MKLKEAIIAFLPTNPNPRTRQTYAYSLNKMSDYVGNRPIDSITPFDMMNYINQLAKADGSPLAPDSINKEIKTCRTFFNWLVKTREITHTPMSAIKYHPTPRRVDRSKAISQDDIALIIKTLKEMRKPREYALIMFLTDTGCRAGGVANLRVGDIDFSTNTAYVVEKGDKQRRVAFGEDTALALTRWIRKRKSKTDFVFQSGNRSFSAEAVGSMVRRCCEWAGTSRLYQSHAFRHAKGHQLADAGVPASIVATALGHESVLTTLKSYFPQDEDRAIKALRDASLGATHIVPPNVVKIPKKITG